MLHSLFWQNLAPKAGGEPTGALGEQMKHDFGELRALPRRAHQRGGDDHGLGLGGAVWEPVAKRLLTAQIHDHQSNVTQGGVPILVLDAWEHAYYLQYGPDKKSFFEAIWNIWNWTDVGRRFEAVRGHRSGPAPGGLTADGPFSSKNRRETFPMGED